MSKFAPTPSAGASGIDDALVEVYWGDVRLEAERTRRGETMIIGPGGRLHAPSLEVTEPFVLLTHANAQWTVHKPPGASVVGEDPTRGPTSVAYALTRNAPVRFLLGPLTLTARLVERPIKVKRQYLDRGDKIFAGILVSALVAFAWLSWGMARVGRSLDADLGDSVRREATFIKFIVPVTPAKPPPKSEKSASEETAQAVKPQPRNSPKPSPAVPKTATDARKVKAAMAGMFGGGSGSTLFAGGGVGAGIASVLNNLKGPGAGPKGETGAGGLGLRGEGAGVGGLGVGGLGIGSPSGHQGNGLGLGDKTREITRIIPGTTTVVGGLDRDVILKIILRHQNEIKFCYESQLNKTPTLAGKIAVSWTISQDGTVTIAQVVQSTMGNTDVEGCILQRIRRWEFPKPLGGGIVSVTFPWVFKSAGEGS